MMNLSRWVVRLSLFACVHANAQTDPLPSWNDGATKKAIIEFVQKTTTQGNPDFVPEPERIASDDQVRQAKHGSPAGE
jgi:hypothetical protein